METFITTPVITGDFKPKMDISKEQKTEEILRDDVVNYYDNEERR